MKRDPREGRPNIHRILLTRQEGELIVDVLKAYENRSEHASAAGAIVRLSQPCPDASEFLDIVLDEEQRFVARMAIMSFNERGPAEAVVLQRLSKIFDDYQLNIDQMSDILGVDLEKMWALPWSKGPPYPWRSLFHQAQFVDAPHRAEEKRLRDMETFRKLEAGGIGRVRRSKSRVYFDWNERAYHHRYRRPIPEKLADDDASALSAIAM